MTLSIKRKTILLKNYLYKNGIASNKLECSNCGAKNVSYEKYLLKDITENKFITDNTKKIFEDIQLREVYMTGIMIVDGKEYNGEIPLRVIFNNRRIIGGEKLNIKNALSSWHTLEFLGAYVSEKYHLKTNDTIENYTDIETYFKKYKETPLISNKGSSTTIKSLEIHDIVTDIYNEYILNKFRNEFIHDQQESDRILGKNWIEKNYQNLKPFCANCQ